MPDVLSLKARLDWLVGDQEIWPGSLAEELYVFEAWRMCQNLAMVAEIVGKTPEEVSEILEPKTPTAPKWEDRLRYLRNRFVEDKAHEAALGFFHQALAGGQPRPDRLITAAKIAKDFKYDQKPPEQPIDDSGGIDPNNPDAVEKAAREAIEDNDDGD